MRFKDKAYLLMGESAAFGWFILRGISPLALLPLPLFGWLYFRLMKDQKAPPLWQNAATLSAAALVGCALLSQGLFQGRGYAALLLLIPAAGLLGIDLQQGELLRISRWWSVAFAAVFILMLLGSLAEIQWQEALPGGGEWWETLLFYLLAFSEPCSLGKRYAASPLILSLFLIPFGAIAFFALGKGAFELAQYPYLSVWSGVAFFSVRHIEGIILGFYYGALLLRSAEFFSKLRQIRCNSGRDMVK